MLLQHVVHHMSRSARTVVLKMNKKQPKSDDFLKHPQLEEKLPDQKHLTNDHASFLHHPQVKSEGMGQYDKDDPSSKKQFDPKKGFKDHEDC